MPASTGSSPRAKRSTSDLPAMGSRSRSATSSPRPSPWPCGSIPALNASFEPDAIVRHAEVNIGIAVALDDGLIVPVLHNADTLGLIEIRVQSEALATAARAGTLTGEQLTGGTFTISNLGMFGTRQFDAILNLPEVGILAVGAAEKRPVVEGDQLTVGTVMTAHLDRRPPRRRRSHGRRISPDLEGAAGRAGVDAALIATFFARAIR